VGDNILMNGEIHRIKKITLLYTEMITLNGERWVSLLHTRAHTHTHAHSCTHIRTMSAHVLSH